ncbi:hypothetical protein, variant 2 [Aphanomyces astaci]|uniref:Uncharacterized protein n=1 Tax=Aphanomyces astaci TaxID=112090 RepID=W4FYG4_APHAT|nr:hypothetical protein H257_12974 [Aphanomyces astaci]XP_009838684.1 hypothetical protein, variant 3 [Aphanomyces astaci]XP_009838685.1 hypothetical protein, variant 5 [Aphanomyces astaci]XP_009838686.1 hypothetical protein, variant 4 [Aphanomyces astaci]XP_009838687.1 hypothetical protein, variant 1 [Aphanomyces astaci]XP_009838688.1 hypothetical protein, variant 2 [Aphanomyces astaci]ETV71834.1 hypothetical protein H257_12974 [Aphanomyces astaci]ETV71835.1 hypothetical protein, variant 1 |eukprot:XP_009838683.1 hypothetical protein H257_12974 [Aphanomyces astaci]
MAQVVRERVRGVRGQPFERKASHLSLPLAESNIAKMRHEFERVQCVFLVCRSHQLLHSRLGGAAKHAKVQVHAGTGGRGVGDSTIGRCCHLLYSDLLGSLGKGHGQGVELKTEEVVLQQTSTDGGSE